MDYRIIYTQKALNNLAEIIGYIAEDSPDTASRFGSALIEHVELLSRFPRMGGVVRKRTHVRKLVHTPILIYYRIDENKQALQILHFRYGMRKPPDSELRA
ncbi:MAG: hypothetical protein DMG65_13120 [Candidatus Angelobacter sp. Gp1-AA117]|nr:MAG: hypothetical protein DMG65_13120 [Candidatus Angelobacter sp. Gp1-AA117]